MGATVCRAVIDAPDCDLVAAVDPQHAGEVVEGTDLTIAESPEILEAASAQVSVDFTVVAAARENLRWCAAHDVHAVVGTTGFTEDDFDELENLFSHSPANALIAPNFAIGAVLMMELGQRVAEHMPEVEIIELHHDRKLDAPSGTAKATAALLPPGTPIHSVRLPGLVAHQEVIFGGPGQTLTIRHDTTSRDAFVPGVLLALERLHTLPPGLTVGLDALL